MTPLSLTANPLLRSASFPTPLHPPPFVRSKFNALDLAGFATGLAATGYRPSQRWLDAYAAAAAARADSVSAARLAAVGAALRRLGYRSARPQAWVAAA